MVISSLTRFAICRGRHLAVSPLLSNIKPAKAGLSLFSTAPAKTVGYTPQPTDVHSLLPQDFTSGHVLDALNKVGANGVALSHQDFRLLLESARPHYRKDARVILTALRNYKRINRFLLDIPLAEDCIDQILSCELDQGGLMIIENFTMESGLYYAAPLSSLHKALEQLLQVVADDEKVGFKEQTQKALPAFIQELLLRKSRPYREMKKRARRRYLFQIQTHDGPSQETIELLIELGLEASNNDIEWVHNELVKPCLDQRVKVEDEMIHAWNAKLLSHTAIVMDEAGEIET